MSKTYEIPFDEADGRFETETITADVVKTGFEYPCELESAEFQYPEDVFDFQFDFVAGSSEVQAEVTLRDEIYAASQFFEIISEEYEVELKVVPREYDESGGFKPGPELRGLCGVSFAEVRLESEWCEPPKSELPIPALGDEEVAFKFKLTLGKGGKPRENLPVRYERVGGCDEEGKLEAIDEVTDADGEVRFTYTAPKLFYQPGAKFYEEYQLFTETEGRRSDLVKIKVPLAPTIKIQLKAEKKGEVDGEDYGLTGDLTEVVEIDARERAKIVEAQPKLEATAEGETRTFPAIKTTYTIFVGDEEGVDVEGPGIELVTDEQGRLRWELEELIAAFEGAGTTYTLQQEKEELPQLELFEASESHIAEFESFLKQQGAFPWDVYQNDPALSGLLKKYRFVFCKQLGGEETSAYERVHSALKLMRTGMTWSGPYRTSFNNQFNPLLGKLGMTFWDSFGLVWNICDWGARLAKSAISLGQRIGRKIADAAPELIQRFLRWTSTHVAGSLKGCVETMKNWIDELGESLPTLSSIWQTVRSGIDDLLAKINEIILLAVPQDAPASEALRIFREWWEKAITAILSAIASTFQTIGKALILVFGKLAQLAMAATAPIVDALAAVVEYCDDVALRRAVECLEDVMVNKLGIPVGQYTEKLHEHFTWAVSKYFGWFADLIWAQFNKAAEWVTGGKASAGTTNFAQLNCFNYLACSAVRSVHDQCEELKVPIDYDSKHDEIKSSAVELKSLQHTLEMSEIDSDFLMSIVDSVVLCFEAAMVLLAMFTTGGLAAFAGAAIAEFSAIEIGMSAIKVFLKDIPQVFTAFIGSAFIIYAHNSATHDLVVGP